MSGQAVQATTVARMYLMSYSSGSILGGHSYEPIVLVREVAFQRRKNVERRNRNQEIARHGARRLEESKRHYTGRSKALLGRESFRTPSGKCSTIFWRARTGSR